MTPLGHDFSERLFKVITNAVSTFLLIVLFYILQYIFDMDFVCSCRPGLHPNGVLYMVVPPMILTGVVNVIESFHRKKNVSSWQSLCPNDCFSHSVKLLFKYFSLSAVWVAAVLFDGDWYFCLMTNFNAAQTGIPCKANLTTEELRIKTDHKTASIDFGFIIIGIVFIVWSFGESIGACCKRRRTWKKGCRSTLCPPYYTVVYEDLLAEQVSCHLKDELTKIATEKARAICRPYLRAIGDHEQPFNQTCDDNVNNTVSEAWQNISASDFYLMEHEREEDSHTGAETSTQDGSSGRGFWALYIGSL